jgi:hypothetical protein
VLTEDLGDLLMVFGREVPSDAAVVEALRELGGHADAVALCNALVKKGHPRLQSQLAIQRATERRMIAVNRDWTFCLDAVAA